jgi:hypothetical protein
LRDLEAEPAARAARLDEEVVTAREFLERMAARYLG